MKNAWINNVMRLKKNNKTKKRQSVTGSSALIIHGYHIAKQTTFVLIN